VSVEKVNSKDRQQMEPVHELGDDLDTEQLPDRWLYFWAMMLGLSVVLGAVIGRPLYRHFKTERAQRLAREVSARVDAGTATNLLPTVRLMLDLAPRNDLVLRAAARFCSSNRMPEAVTYWRMLLDTVPGSHDDHLALAKAAMDLGQYDVATRELGLLIVRSGGDLEATRLALRLCLKRGAWKLAVRAADQVLQMDPNDEQAEIWRDTALIRTRLPANLSNAKADLIALMFRSKTRWKEAVDVLLDVPGLTRPELRLARRRVQSEAATTWVDQMRQMSVDWLLDVDQRDVVIGRALRIVGGNGQSGDVLQAGRWLLAHEAAEPLLKGVPLEAIKGDRIRMQLHVMALARLGQWEQVAAIVDQPDTGLDAHIAQVMSIAAAGVKPDGLPQSRAQAVLANRDLTLAELLEAAQLAEEYGLYEAAILLMEPLLANPATMPEAANHILALASNTDSLLLRRRALDRLLNGYPTDLLALQQLGYLEAVVPGGDLGVVRILDRRPGSATNQFTQLICALGDIRNGKADAALARLAAAGPAGQSEDYRLHMAYAAAYGAAGDNHEARRHAALAEQARMQLEERDLISRWLPVKTSNP